MAHDWTNDLTALDLDGLQSVFPASAPVHLERHVVNGEEPLHRHLTLQQLKRELLDRAGSVPAHQVRQGHVIDIDQWFEILDVAHSCIASVRQDFENAHTPSIRAMIAVASM